jgi:hypothetical protein
MGTDVYIQRRPENTAFNKIVSGNYESFEQNYNICQKGCLNVEVTTEGGDVHQLEICP